MKNNSVEQNIGIKISGMKKNLYVLLSFAAVLCAMSCTKEIKDAGEEYGIEKELSFSASSASVKTTLDGSDVLWENSDEIAVFSSSSPQRFTATEIGSDQKSAIFNGTAVTAATYYALYPYDENAVCDDGVITATLPSVQTFTENSFSSGANLAVASTTGNTLSFQNVGGIISFSLDQEDVTSVTLSSSQSLAGKVKVSVGSEPSITEIVDGSSSVTLNGTFQKGNKYYFVVLPGSYSDLKITIATATGNVELTNPTTLVVGRNSNIAFNKVFSKLATPKNISFSQVTYTQNRTKAATNQISWDPVENATGYVVKANGSSLTVSGTTAELGRGNGDLTITVQAVNEDYPDIYLASEDGTKSITARFYGGGTAAVPYYIYNAQDWKEFVADCASYSYTGKFVKVMEDIDFNNESITAAGISSTKCFCGELDGNGKTLKNIKLGDGTVLSPGLFYALAGTVKNLIVDNAAVVTPTSGTTKGAVISAGDTGAAAKIIDCTVKNSSITCRGYGSIIAACLKSGANEIRGCVVDGCSITGSDNGAGAIVAYLAYTGARVVDCVVKNSTISAKGVVGSIVGTGNMGYVVNCIADNNTVTSVSNAGTGALVGANASTASGLHIVNNLTKACTVVNTTNTSEAYLSLLLGKEAVTAGKTQNNVVVSGKINHACTTKPRIGFFVGTKGSGAWNYNYYNLDLVTTANQGTGGDLGPIGSPAFAGAKTGGSTSVASAAGEGVDVVLADLVSTLNSNIAAQGYSTDFPEIRNWVAGTDGWPTFDYSE